MDEGTRFALALCLTYDQPPSRSAGLYLLEPEGDVRLQRHPGGEQAARAELHRQGADLVLSIPDAFMSSRHAVLRRDVAGQLRAEDLGSKNGTRLCGVALRHGSRPLRHGDEIEVGRTLLRLLRLERPSRGQQEDDARDRVLEVAPQPTLPGWPPTLSPALRRLLGVASRLAGAQLPVLIQGEPGTGKRALARHLHERYAAAGHRGPLLAVPPGGRLPLRELHGGTLLVEDVGRLSLGAQLDLLRLLRASSPRSSRTASVQVVATTDIDLGVLARGSAFRPDLLLHLSTVTLSLPPVRERKEDLALLTEFYLRQLGGEPEGAGPEGPPGSLVSIDAWRRLFAYDWPGNVRELRDVLREALRRQRAARRAQIEPADLPDPVQHGFREPGLPGIAPPLPWVPVLSEGGRAEVPAVLPAPTDREARREALVQALHAENGKVARAARRLGLSRVHVHRLARQLGINLDDFRVRKRTRKL